MSAGQDQLPDRPVVVKLKGLDDQYLSLQREFDLERNELAKRYTEKQKEFIVRRKELLTAATSESPKTGTPALTGFWCKALQNHEAFQDKIREWDQPVLEYLSDIEVERFDPESKGFKLTLRFAENPYFSNEDLSVEYHTAEANPYLDTVDVEKIVSSKISWKPGQDITVATVAKKVKGGGSKKAKAKKEQEQSRPSFFAEFTFSLNQGMEPEVVATFLGVDQKEITEDGEIPAALMSNIMETHYELGVALRDNIIPFAVRWYTGEACADDDDDDDDDEDEEEESEDSDDDEDDGSEEDNESAPVAKAKPVALGPDATK